ncbi:MAG TPA: DUF6496 domain-containing protein [Terriglobia bacterium]|nr:DUF6496 domain-containing protein [Terriglobia bacterium]
MPENQALHRAEQDKSEGKSPGTQAGEFVREEIRHVREGKHGAVSAKQVIAIGLSKARRAGVKLGPPARGKTSSKIRKQAMREIRRGKTSRQKKASARRSRAISGVLRHEGHQAASHNALSRQAHRSAKRRGSASLHRAALKAVRTKGPTGLRAAARKAARTRSRNG